jgi:hypothetical protein
LETKEAPGVRITRLHRGGETIQKVGWCGVTQSVASLNILLATPSLHLLLMINTCAGNPSPRSRQIPFAIQAAVNLGPYEPHETADQK